MRVAWEWLHSCGGCEATLLDLGEALPPLLRRLEIVHMSLLHDHRYGSDSAPEIPGADLGLVSGGVAFAGQQRLLETMRRRCDLLVALGTCATHGGIPALMNSRGMVDGLDGIAGSVGIDPDVVEPLERVHALDEIVQVDMVLPGCPPDPEQVGGLLTAILDGREPARPSRSVCDSCPAIRTGERREAGVKRFCSPPEVAEAGEAVGLRCLQEQGFLCLGPVTAGGCGMERGPHCIRVGVPCRGCLGPVGGQGNQMVAMLNILASGGVDFRTVLDRRGLLRFAGAHGRLRPGKGKKR